MTNCHKSGLVNHTYLKTLLKKALQYSVTFARRLEKEIVQVNTSCTYLANLQCVAVRALNSMAVELTGGLNR